MTAATLLAAARAVAVVDEVVLVEHDRDVSLPIHEQRRFRSDLVTAGVDALRHVLLDLVDPADRPGWREQALVHLLPGLCRDAVGGGPPFHAVVQTFALDLVAGGVRIDTVPVEARIAGLGRGPRHVRRPRADRGLPRRQPARAPGRRGRGPGTRGPHHRRARGLPADRRRRPSVAQPGPRPGAAPRRAGAGAGRRLRPHRARHRPAEGVDRGRGRPARARCRSAAGTTTAPTSGPHGPGRTAVTAASRARSCCRLATRRGAVRVELGGQVAEHRARLLPAASGVDTVTLEPAGARLSGAGDPVRLRLAGPLGTTPWSDASPRRRSLRGGAGAGHQVAVGPDPAARWALRARGAGSTGEAADLDWSPALLADPPDLVDERSALRLARGGRGRGRRAARRPPAQRVRAAGTGQRVRRGARALEGLDRRREDGAAGVLPRARGGRQPGGDRPCARRP